MDRKMIFVLLLSGYIFTKPVATQTPGTNDTLDSTAETSATNAGPAVYTPVGGPNQILDHGFSQSVMVVIIIVVIAGIIGIIVGSAYLFLRLRRRSREQTSAPNTSEPAKKTEDTP